MELHTVFRDRYPLWGVMVLGFLLVACTPPGSSIQGENLSQSVKAMASRDMNRYPMNKIVCDPLEGGAPSSPPPQNGIRAELAYLPPATSPFLTSGKYFSHGSRSTQQLFFSDLNVPTRMFDTGFSSQTSDVVRNDMGEKLIEYFGLRFKSRLKLTAEQSEGLYELAVLSDDGTTVTIKSGEQAQKLIDNEGDHPTRMGCATGAISLSRSEGTDLDITYYQGPRYHISLILMWRKVETANPTKDTTCGKTGNHTYFDPDNASTPQKEYKNLLTRGWSPIPKENFFLPESEDLNPCTPGLPLTISDLRQLPSNSSDLVVAWTTNRPATTQALVVDQQTGEQFLTASDQSLSEAHRLVITGLTPGKLYKISGLSVAEDGARTMSEPIIVEGPIPVVCTALECT